MHVNAKHKNCFAPEPVECDKRTTMLELEKLMYLTNPKQASLILSLCFLSYIIVFVLCFLGPDNGSKRMVTEESA